MPTKNKMRSLNDPAQVDLVIKRIDRLTPATQPLWGRMNSAQMLAHIQSPILVATGALKLKRGLMSFLFGGIARKTMVSTRPFGKNLPTDKNFVVSDERDFEKEKTSAVALIRKFAIEQNITEDPHPFFGKLTKEEWNILIWKHMDHHLRQFGV